jgi:hypothetical protein
MHPSNPSLPPLTRFCFSSAPHSMSHTPHHGLTRSSSLSCAFHITPLSGDRAWARVSSSIWVQGMPAFIGHNVKHTDPEPCLKKRLYMKAANQPHFT